MRSFCWMLSILVMVPALACAGEEPAWQGMLGDLARTEKAGFGGLCGICVDHATGAVFINLSDRGFYRSTDGARTFQRLGTNQPRGRTESPGCFLLDPTGTSKRMLTALVYGAPASTSADGGSTWKSMDSQSSHVDWCAVDWTDPDLRFVLILKHESGGLLLASRDGGQKFSEVGKSYGPGWVFDNATAVVAEAKTKDRPRPNLVRTTDGGVTWKPCAAYIPVGGNSAQALPHWYDGALYWLVDGGLIVSRDKGANWEKLSNLQDGRYGPVFGRTAKHLFVLAGRGVIESTDGGKTWSEPLAPPRDLKGTGGLTWLEFDPTSDSLYLMKMGSDLFKLARGK